VFAKSSMSEPTPTSVRRAAIELSRNALTAGLRFVLIAEHGPADNPSVNRAVTTT